MSERVQNVTPRARRAAPRVSKRASTAPRQRRSVKVGRVVRGVAMMVAIVMAIALPIVGAYFVIASGAFRIRHVEVQGTSRVSSDRIEQIVRAAAGPHLITADLDEIRKAVANERAVQSVTVARVLPDTIRVRVEEREPAVVVRLTNGDLAWVDAKAHVVADFKPEDGDVPPPLTGFEDGDASDRAAADNRDRVAMYAGLRTALDGDKMWNWIDEVNARYPKDLQVRLVDGGVLVRLGGEQFRERLTRALLLLDAAKRGDTAALARMNIQEADAERIVASPDLIARIDATPNNKMTIAFRRAGGGDAGRN